MDDYVRMAVLDNAIEAEAMRCALEGAGIAHAVISFYDSAYDGLFQMQQGWGCVMAHKSNEQVVLDILRDLRAEGDAIRPWNEEV
jgi:hypothetical protein